MKQESLQIRDLHYFTSTKLGELCNTLPQTKARIAMLTKNAQKKRNIFNQSHLTRDYSGFSKNLAATQRDIVGEKEKQWLERKIFETQFIFPDNQQFLALIQQYYPNRTVDIYSSILNEPLLKIPNFNNTTYNYSMLVKALECIQEINTYFQEKCQEEQLHRDSFLITMLLSNLQFIKTSHSLQYILQSTISVSEQEYNALQRLREIITSYPVAKTISLDQFKTYLQKQLTALKKTTCTLKKYNQLEAIQEFVEQHQLTQFPCAKEEYPEAIAQLESYCNRPNFDFSLIQTHYGLKTPELIYNKLALIEFEKTKEYGLSKRSSLI